MGLSGLTDNLIKGKEDITSSFFFFMMYNNWVKNRFFLLRIYLLILKISTIFALG